MLKRLIKHQQDAGRSPEELLTLELSEVQEIAEKLFERIDKKIKALESIEERVDKKIDMLERLLLRAENLNVSADSGTDSRYREVNNLAKKGLKVDEIAKILDIPKGEVELILSIAK
jgi:DNA-binding NarL/FixJ family response regulator